MSSAAVVIVGFGVKGVCSATFLPNNKINADPSEVVQKNWHIMGAELYFTDYVI